MSITSSSDGTAFATDSHRTSHAVEALKQDVANLAGAAADAAKSGAAHAVEAAKGSYGDAKQAASDATDSLRELVTKNPVASLGIAAGVGLLVGLVVFRPRS